MDSYLDSLLSGLLISGAYLEEKGNRLYFSSKYIQLVKKVADLYLDLDIIYHYNRDQIVATITRLQSFSADDLKSEWYDEKFQKILPDKVSINNIALFIWFAQKGVNKLTHKPSKKEILLDVSEFREKDQFRLCRCLEKYLKAPKNKIRVKNSHIKLSGDIFDLFIEKCKQANIRIDDKKFGGI